jgi:hypothetical protein
VSILLKVGAAVQRPHSGVAAVGRLAACSIPRAAELGEAEEVTWPLRPTDKMQPLLRHQIHTQIDPLKLIGVNLWQFQVTASHGPGIEPCRHSGNGVLDA